MIKERPAMAKKKNTLDENKSTLAAGASTVLTSLVLFKTFELVQNLKQNFQGAPNSYALWPALALAIYAFLVTKDTKVKYVSIAVLAVLATCILVWFFGVTGAVNLQYNYK
jgi:cation transporter-like permease